MSNAYTKVRTITVKKKDIFFDLDMLSIGFSEVSGGENLRRSDRIALDTSSDNGSRTATRLCDHRVSDLQQLIEKFLDTSTGTSYNNSLAAGDYVFTIRISTEAEDNIFPQLTDLFHEYIVNGALADYYSKLGLVNVEPLLASCTEALARIRTLIYYRPMP